MRGLSRAAYYSTYYLFQFTSMKKENVWTKNVSKCFCTYTKKRNVYVIAISCVEMLAHMAIVFTVYMCESISTHFDTFVFYTYTYFADMNKVYA